MYKCCYSNISAINAKGLSDATLNIAISLTSQ